MLDDRVARWTTVTHRSATLLYLATVASCLLVPLYFPGFEGVEQRINIPLVIASACHAALHPGDRVPPFWRTALAAGWFVGATAICTPHLFLSHPVTQVRIQETIHAFAGGLLALGAVRGILMNRALRVLYRSLYGTAVLLTGLLFVSVGAPLLPRADWIAWVFYWVVLGTAVMTVASVLFAGPTEAEHP